MLHVTVNRHLCVGAGLCVLSSDEVFDQGDDDGLVVLRLPDPPPELYDKVRGAARRCPALAITVEEAPSPAAAP